jgi:hypothetical protein
VPGRIAWQALRPRQPARLLSALSSSALFC